MTESAPRTARERARLEITAEILRVAREHLARDGAAALSLRAVARDLGMVSSAVYRYVPHRDALLTMLIIDAYNALGAEADRSEAAVARPQLTDRFLAICHAVRTWALKNPHEYALVYGSPVPGYAAPSDTIEPAARVPNLLLAILADAAHAHKDPAHKQSALHGALTPLRTFADPAIPDDLLLRGLNAWAGLFGAVSFELFGQTRNVVAEGVRLRRAYFDHQMRALAGTLDLTN